MTDASLAVDAVVAQYRARHDNVFLLSAGDRTEELARFLTTELSDDELDEVDVYHDLERRDDLASEALTAALLVGVGSTLFITVGRIIERWLEQRRQADQIVTVLTAFKQSSEAGMAVAAIAQRHAGVAVKYQLATPSPS